MVNTEEISKVGLCHVQFLLYWLWPDVEQDNKAAEVNEYLRNMCKESEIPFIKHGKRINPRKHLNKSKLYLNEKGSFILGKTFLDHIKFLFDWDDNPHCVNERKDGLISKLKQIYPK